MEFTVDADTWLTLFGLVVATFVLWFTARRNERETRGELKAELGAGIAGLRTELKAELGGDIARLETSIADLRTELRVDIAKLETSVARLDDRVYALAARIAPALPEPAQRADA